jgi:hypothetical protein
MRNVRLEREDFINGAVANEPGVKRHIDKSADKLAANAEAVLVGHRDEGNAHIEVDYVVPSEHGQYGEIDAVVWLVDEPHDRADGTTSEGNPLAIEFGHVHNFTGEWVDGIFPLHRAIINTRFD